MHLCRKKPSPAELTAGTWEFDRLWKKKRRKKAVDLYYRLDRPFWLTQEVGEWFERSGRVNQAMTEYEGLMREFIKMKILPLPGGPRELFKVGKWYSRRSPRKARQHLKMYLSAGIDPGGEGRPLRHKAEAIQLLSKMKICC
ncbi:MAG: hypothetical protein WCJ71_09000 [Candidatus Omnitrophota bacterium]